MTFGRNAELDGANDVSPNESSPLLGEEGINDRKPPSLINSMKSKLKDKTLAAWTFANSKTGRGVFKCSVAYLLGSMATFIPAISNSLGQQDGKHMVATITVYFHPARSVGSMFEAMICATVAFIYAAFISFSSMAVSIFFGKTLNLIVLGHIVVLIVFCGAGMGFIGWIKQRLGNPLVNISCSLTSLAIITVLTKEGAVQAAEFSDDKVTQVMLMILMGVAATTAVSFLISPTSARKGLRSDLVQIADVLSDQLTLITQAFLSGCEESLQKQSYLDTLGKYKKTVSSMMKNLREAKFEHFVLGTEREYHLEARIVNSMQRLGQNIGGLRSAATTQFILLAEPEMVGPQAYYSNKMLRKRVSSSTSLAGTLTPIDSPSFLQPIDETPEAKTPDDSDVIKGSTELSRAQSRSSTEDVGSQPPFHSPSDIFAYFIAQLGPSMVRRNTSEVTLDTNFDHRNQLQSP